MALKDLIIDQKQITDDLLENILKGHIHLIKETKGVNLIKESQKFSSKTKTLLFLCGKKAWELLDKGQEKVKTTINELVQTLGIQNNTIRPLLKGLKDDGLVFSDKGKYYILPKGILSLKDLIEIEKKKGIVSIRREGIKKSPKIKGRPDIIQKFQNKSLSPQYIEEILPILEKSKHHDRYLLALFIAQEKMKIKSMTPSEISILLTEPPIKLPKLYTTNISRDLSKKLRKFATPYKAESGFGYEYRLTSFGEERVKNLINKIKKETSKEG